ncbi:hypothetical protein AAKU67_002164 [Oxalobacteraceae bacterium GrIS 2.11]
MYEQPFEVEDFMEAQLPPEPLQELPEGLIADEV